MLDGVGVVTAQDVIGTLGVVRVGDTGHDDTMTRLERVEVQLFARFGLGERLAGALPEPRQRVLCALLLVNLT